MSFSERHYPCENVSIVQCLFCFFDFQSLGIVFLVIVRAMRSNLLFNQNVYTLGGNWLSKLKWFCESDPVAADASKN